MWIEEKNCYLCEDEGSNLNIMTITLKSIVSCEVLGFGDSFQVIILGMHTLNHVNVPQCMKSLQILEICVYQVFTRGFAEVYQLAQKIRERIVIMQLGMCEF